MTPTDLNSVCDIECLTKGSVQEGVMTEAKGDVFLPDFLRSTDGTEIQRSGTNACHICLHSHSLEGEHLKNIQIDFLRHFIHYFFHQRHNSTQAEIIELVLDEVSISILIL